MTTAKKTPTKEKSSPKSNRIRKWALIIGIPLLLLGLFTGHVPYFISFIKCGGSPVTANKVAASYRYWLPGQEGHGPKPFRDYFCTEQEAQKAGFDPIYN